MSNELELNNTKRTQGVLEQRSTSLRYIRKTTIQVPNNQFVRDNVSKGGLRCDTRQSIAMGALAYQSNTYRS